MLSLVTARARTRGKSPVEFTFPALGRLKPRFVLDKDNLPVLVDKDNKTVKYEEKDLAKTDKGELIAPDGTRFVEVDDVEVDGLTSDLNEVISFLGTMSDEQRGGKDATQFLINAALDGINYQNRKNAAPVSEQVTGPDELTPIIAGLLEHKILATDTDATTWRRNMTSGAKTFEVERIDYVKMSPQYKKLLKAGWKPETVAA